MIQSIAIYHALCLSFALIAFSSQAAKGSSHHSSPFYHPLIKSRTRSSLFSKNLPLSSFVSNNQYILRGGAGDNNHDGENDDHDDEERYSRQVYTLGSRAHSLVRKSTIIIDGPLRSGLAYESIKNLALSGVGKIIILDNHMGSGNDEGLVDDYYFDDTMDDLGAVYRRGALRECFPNDKEDEVVDDAELMAEYVRRINPNVKVCIMKRKDFLEGIKASEKSLEEIVDLVGTNPVLLCVDRPLSTQIMLNKACRMIGGSSSSDSDVLSMTCIPFVSIETAGVYGKVFCDFGDDFHVVDEDGETPKTTLLQSVERLDSNEGGEVVMNCLEGERHDVSKGDLIEFQFKNGISDQQAEILDNVELIVTYVKNPTCFNVNCFSKKEKQQKIEGSELDKIIDGMNNNVNGFSRVKIPRAIPFLSLEKALAAQNDPSESLFAASDLEKSFDPMRRSAIMASFAALESVKKAKLTLSDSSDENDFVNAVMASSCTDKKQFSSIVSSFARCAKAKFTPIQAIYGALGAQEVLKATSGLYNPIRQFLLYDCDEVLVHSNQSAIENDKSSASGMKYILGKGLVKKLSSQKIFVVGSGAIGCELLKNLAAMEVGTKKKKGGCIILTDMDTIEKSNLSRQLLFRDGDVGKFKSIAAQEAIQRLNPKVHVIVHTSKVGDQTKETYFDDIFWSEGVDVVLNALDNVEARLFIDSQCVANQKPLIDAGTLGAKGNVQVVVPCQSESYASSTDPPEPTIPVCTLKNFPYEISHTIQWARDLFDGLFNRRPSQVNEYKQQISSMQPSEFAKSLFDKLGEDAAMDMANELAEDCISFDTANNDFPEKLKLFSLTWACKLAKSLFYDAFRDLLKQHPIDSVDDEGIPFWSGSRRPPTPLRYSDDLSNPEEMNINKSIIDFVRCASRLRIETYLTDSLLGDKNYMTQFHVSAEDAKAALTNFGLEENSDSDDATSFQRRLTEKIKIAKMNSSRIQNGLNSMEFEKDEDTNGHVAFVTSASNLRAIAYGIPPVDAMETRRVAGRIVPAMITTTALVSALSCIELVKLIQKADLRWYRNAFVNLALPFFAFTAPLPAETVQGLHGLTFTLWDKISIQETEKQSLNGGITLRQLLRRIKKKAQKGEESIEISNVSFGPYMLYANFLHEDDDDVLDSCLQKLVEDAVSSGDIEDEDEELDVEEVKTEAQIEEVKALQRRQYLDFTVIVEDPETGEEGELPPVRLVRWRQK